MGRRRRRTATTIGIDMMINNSSDKCRKTRNTDNNRMIISASSLLRRRVAPSVVISLLAILLTAAVCAFSPSHQLQQSSRSILQITNRRRYSSSTTFTAAPHSITKRIRPLIISLQSAAATIEEETIQKRSQIIDTNNKKGGETVPTTYNAQDIISSLHNLKRYKTQRDVERAIVKLGRHGRTDEAIQLYNSVWVLDSLRQQYRTKLQKKNKLQQQNQNQQAAPTTPSDEIQLQFILNNNNSIIIDLPPDLTKYIITSTNKSKFHSIRPTTRLMNSVIDACSRSSSTNLPYYKGIAFTIFNSAVKSIYNPIDNTKKSGGALSPNVFTFGSLLACCARVGDIDTSLTLLKVLEEGEEYSDVVLNEVIYSTVISACERSEVPNVKLALEVLNRGIITLSNGSSRVGGGDDGDAQKTKTQGIMGVVGYNTVISAMARAMHWKLAVQLLGEMILQHSQQQQQQESSATDEPLLRTNNLFSRLEEIREETLDFTPLLKHVNGKDDKKEGQNMIITPKPDEVTFGTVLAACERSGEWEELLHVAEAATEYGVKLDGLALTSALHSCQQLGLADDALEYLELMKRLGDEDSEEDDGDATTQRKRRKGAKQTLKGPDSVAYRLAISACARAPGGHRWQDGISLLDEMRQAAIDLDVVAYTAAIAGCSEAGEYTHAMSLISEMRKEGIKPNVVTFSAVINACASASAKMAKQTEDDINNNGVSLEEIRLPMNRALRLLDAMQSPKSSVKPNIVTYNAAIRACAEGLNLDGAFDLLRQLKEDGLDPTIVTYGSLMTACERVEDIEAASKVFRMVKEEEEKKSNTEEESEEGNTNDQERLQVNEIIYGAAISCCRKAQQPERALLLLRKMISENLSPNTALFNTVIAALAEPGRADSKTAKNDLLWEKALAVYKVMKSKHAPPGVTPNRQTYNILVRCLSMNLEPGYAESILSDMRKAGFVPDVNLYTMTVRSYEKCGNPMKALALMENMREDGYDFYDIKVLDDAFKSGIKLLNRVGKGLVVSSDNDTEWEGFSYAPSDEMIDFVDDDDFIDSLK